MLKWVLVALGLILGGLVLAFLFVSHYFEEEISSMVPYNDYQISMDKSDYKPAYTHINEAIALNPKNSKFHVAAGGVASKLKRYEKARMHYIKAYNILDKSLGANHPDIAMVLKGIGLSWYLQGSYEKAIEYYDKALSIDKENFGDEHSNIATVHGNIAQSWYNLGEYKKAIHNFEALLKIRIKLHGYYDRSTAVTRYKIGLSWHKLGEYKKAIEYYEISLKVFQEKFGMKHEKTKIVERKLAEAHKALNEKTALSN